MKKFINSVDDFLTESLAGFAAAHSDLVALNQEPVFVRRKTLKTGKVALISGGGSGHEPLHSGFVGYGMLDAACPGQVFTSPTPDQMMAAAKAVDASPLDSTRGPNDIVVNIDRTTTAAGAYPAVLVSYLAVCNTYDTQAKADLIKAYAGYVASSAGQSAAASAAGSAPISPELQSKVSTALTAITAKA